jgi:hypothetical protein
MTESMSGFLSLKSSSLRNPEILHASIIQRGLVRAAISEQLLYAEPALERHSLARMGWVDAQSGSCPLLFLIAGAHVRSKAGV